MPLSIAIARFLREFDVLDTQYVGMALHALTGDGPLIEQAQRRLQLQARLTLLKRVAMGSAADSYAVGEIERIIEQATQLLDKREQLSRSFPAAESPTLDGLMLASYASASVRIGHHYWAPTEHEIGEYNQETVGLQQSLQSLAETFRRAVKH